MIILQLDNVVRRVASDEAARKLEEQGFTRTGGIAEIDNAALMSGIEEGVTLNIDVDALADKLAERIKAGESLTEETVAKALADGAEPADTEQPAKPAAKANKPKGGKAAAKAGAAHDGA